MDSLPTLAAIVAVGARTPLGLDACQSGFLFRAGFPGMNLAPLGPDGQEITFCRQTALPLECTGAERALELARPALDEALEPKLDAATLLLGLDDDIGPAFLRQFRAPCALTLAGSAGLYASLRDALRHDCMVLGGVHTTYDPQQIAGLAAQGRLYDDENLDAILPGEAAAFVTLASPAFAKRRGLPVLARICGIGTALERARFDNDEPAATARAATAAVRQACKPLADRDLTAGWILSDISFESWRMLEWQSMFVRCSNRFGPPYRIDFPAHRIGSLGAAALPLCLTLAAEAFRAGYAPAPIALVFGGSESGERGAMIVAAA